MSTRDNTRAAVDEAEHTVNTILIDLDEVPLSEVLARQDSALGLAVRCVLRSETDDGDEQPMIAEFSNF